jgi:hypothetical protein
VVELGRGDTRAYSHGDVGHHEERVSGVGARVGVAELLQELAQGQPEDSVVGHDVSAAVVLDVLRLSVKKKLIRSV